MKIKILFIVFVQMICFVFTAIAQDEDILEAHAKRLAAMTARDTNTIKQYLDDELLYVHSNGLHETKRQHIDAIAGGKIIYQTIAAEQPPLVMRKNRMAMLNGKMDVDGLYQGTPFTVHLSFLAVYRKSKGVWKLLSWQSAKL